MRVSRREAMLGGAAIGTAFAVSGARAAAGAERPNILWLVSEDNNPSIGAYGDRLARTPNIDALAAQGVLYRNAYSTAPVCAPSRYALLTGARAEGNAPANHMRAAATLPDGWRTTPEFMRAAGYYCTNNSKTDYNCTVDPAAIWDASSATAHYANRPAGKPFFSVFNFMATHESTLFHAPAGRLGPADVRVPPHLPDTPGVRADIAAYYNAIEKMDGEVGRHLAALAAAGLAEDTIVFYYSDNGGTLPTSKRYASDRGLRVALVAYYPPRWAHLAPAAPGSTIAAPVTLMDLPPTILRLAGERVPAQMEGRPLVRGVAPPRYAFGMRNRMDERYDFVRSVTDGRWRYTRNYMPHLPSGQYGAFEWQARGYRDLETEYLAGRLTPAQARFFEPRAFEELYDLAADPHELTNLAADPAPAARATLRRMRAALDAQMIAINDNGFIPEGSPIEGRGPSRRKGAYPLRRLMRLGAVAGARDKRNLSAFVRGLDDPNETIRYWNAMALAMLGPEAAAALPALRARLAAEASPQVRVALAEAIGRAGDVGGAAAALCVPLNGEESVRVKLQAINALTHIGAADAATLAAVGRAKSVKDEYVSRAAQYHELRFTGRYRPDVNIFVGVGGARGR